MKTSSSRRSYFLAALLAFLALCVSWLGNRIERDFGRVDVNTVIFMTEELQPMVAKLYRPLTATAEHPAPGLLALHGYQSDKEAASTFGALELARRGYVVLAIDQFGHGYSTRFPASNKNMSGSNNGYQYLKSLPFVDPNRLGIFGHSTGALNAIRVARANLDHRAVNGQSSNGGEMRGLNNYLLTQGLYEEIGGYRERTFPVKDLIRNANRLKAFDLPADATLEWNHTYGNFTDGSARRADLVSGTHLGVMISAETNRSAIDWFGQAFDQKNNIDGYTYWHKEFCGLAALFFALAAMLFLANGLLALPYFAAACQPVERASWLSWRTWLGFGMINIALTMLLYPVFTQWGGANEPIAAVLPFMPLEMGNGIITWLLVNALVSVVFFILWRHGQPIPLDRLGITVAPAQGRGICRHVVLAFLLVGTLYALTLFIYNLFAQELRFLWPLLKPMTNARWQIFPVYWLLIFIAFAAINGLILTAQMKQPVGKSFAVTWLRWSLGSIAISVGGLCMLWCLHFIPDYLQIGPGFDVLGLPKFGGRWMMMLPVIISQFCAMIVINHWCYLKTGYIWLGVTLTSLLMAWMMVGGQVIGRFTA